MSAAIDSVFIVNMNGTFLGASLTLDYAQEACEKVYRQSCDAMGWDVSPLEWIETDEGSYAVSKNKVFAIWESALM